MTIHELQRVLKAHDLHVYPDSGGIYTFIGRHFIASVSHVQRNKLPISIDAIRLNKRHINTHPKYYKAIQAVCAINGIQVIGAE